MRFKSQPGGRSGVEGGYLRGRPLAASPSYTGTLSTFGLVRAWGIWRGLRARMRADPAEDVGDHPFCGECSTWKVRPLEGTPAGRIQRQYAGSFRRRCHQQRIADREDDRGRMGLPERFGMAVENSGCCPLPDPRQTPPYPPLWKWEEVGPLVRFEDRERPGFSESVRFVGAVTHTPVSQGAAVLDRPEQLTRRCRFLGVRCLCAGITRPEPCAAGGPRV